MTEINTIVFAGCGALGSLIASHLNAPDTIEYVLIDDDIVEEVNVGTSIYEMIQVGIPKVQALGTLLYRRNRRRCYIQKSTIKSYLYYGSDHLVIDTLDNPKSRNLTRGDVNHVLHCGVSPDFTGSILWEEVCPEIEETFQRGENPICTNQIGAKIIRLVAMYSCLIIEEFLTSEVKLNKGVSLKL